jgi:hypothetical protein
MKDPFDTQLTQELLAGTDIYSFLDQTTIEKLPGGVVSVVLAITTNRPIVPGRPCDIVLKHTLDYKHDAPLDNAFGYRDRESLLKPAPYTHHLDYRILNLLQELDDVHVPFIVKYYPEKRTTIMTDFRADGYRLMQDALVDGTLSLLSAVEMGKSLAFLVQKYREINELIMGDVVEDAVLQARERLDELYMFLRPQLSLYREIENKFLSGKYVIPTDTHPKNAAVNQKDKILLFDFGRSIVADEQFPAPNFAAHIALANIGGCFKDAMYGVEYIEKFLGAYNQTIEKSCQVNELWFTRYFMSELLHRGLSGRWLDKKLFANSSLQEVERAVHDISIDVFRPEKGEGVESIGKLLSIVYEVSESVKQGKYKERRNLSMHKSDL